MRVKTGRGRESGRGRKRGRSGGEKKREGGVEERRNRSISLCLQRLHAASLLSAAGESGWRETHTHTHTHTPTHTQRFTYVQTTVNMHTCP